MRLKPATPPLSGFTGVHGIVALAGIVVVISFRGKLLIIL